MSPSGKSMVPGGKNQFLFHPHVYHPGGGSLTEHQLLDLNIRTRILPDNIKRQQIGIPVFEIPIRCLFCGMDTL